MKLNENQENSLLISFGTTTFEKFKSNQRTTDGIEEENAISLIVSADLIVHPLLSKSQSFLISTQKIESAKVLIKIYFKYYS